MQQYDVHDEKERPLTAGDFSYWPSPIALALPRALGLGDSRYCFISFTCHFALLGNISRRESVLAMRNFRLVRYKLDALFYHNEPSGDITMNSLTLRHVVGALAASNKSLRQIASNKTTFGWVFLFPSSERNAIWTRF